MKKNVLISFCVPTFNRLSDLKKSIESIYKQALEGVNFEILVSDDSSNDTTREYLENLHFKNLKYYKNKINGQFNNLNHLLILAKGEYIIFLHDDDVLDDSYLNNILDCIKNNSYSMIWTGKRLIDNNDDFLSDEITKNKNTMVSLVGIKLLLDIIRDNNIHYSKKLIHPMVTGLCIRRDLLEKVGNFDNKFYVNADGLFLWKALFHCQNFLYINRPLVKYRVVDNSERSRPSEKGIVYQEMKGILDSIVSYLFENNAISNSDSKKIYYNFYSNCLSLNGPLIWTALRYKGSYFNRLNIQKKIISESYNNYRPAVLNIRSLFIIVLSLFPQLLLKLAYNIYLRKTA